MRCVEGWEWSTLTYLIKNHARLAFLKTKSIQFIMFHLKMTIFSTLLAIFYVSTYVTNEKKKALPDCLLGFACLLGRSAMKYSDM